MNEYVTHWSDVLRKWEWRNGFNKLRVYGCYKQVYGTEFYVLNKKPRIFRSALAKFRRVVAFIRVETGRYEGVRAYLSRIEKCFHCLDSVDDDVHGSFKCVRIIWRYQGNSIFCTFYQCRVCSRCCMYVSSHLLCGIKQHGTRDME